jgi:dihydrofolate synthase/folylpolyglutamate synthase
MDFLRMDYVEALEYLSQFTNFETKVLDAAQSHRFNLDRIQKLLATIGNPQQQLRCVHIAGTKGKGSTAAMLEAVLRASGYRVGLYISPHLQDIRERLQIDRTWVSQETFARLLTDLKSVIETLSGITFFEILTAMALNWFAEEQVDIAVIEVGLGGRLDATNVVTPLVSVITKLGIDHAQFLGHSIGQIASEKGGIIKPGVPVVTCRQEPAALAVLQSIAAERGTPLTIASTETRGLVMQQLKLRGQHQRQNANLVSSVVAILQQQGWRIPEQALTTGFATVEWAGRFEVHTPPASPTIILDVAHNPTSITALRATLLEQDPNQPCGLLFAAMRDKDARAMLQELLPLMDWVYLAGLPDNSRAYPPQDLLSLIKLHTQVRLHRQLLVVPNAAAGIALARQNLPANAVLLVTGSVALVGSAQHYLQSI